MNDLRLSSQDLVMAPSQDLDLTCGLPRAPQLLITCTTALTLFCLSLGSAFRKGHQESGAQAADSAVGVAEGASPQTASISTAWGRRPGLETQSSHAGSQPNPTSPPPQHLWSTPCPGHAEPLHFLPSHLTLDQGLMARFPSHHPLPLQQTLRGPLTGRR